MGGLDGWTYAPLCPHGGKTLNNVSVVGASFYQDGLAVMNFFDGHAEGRKMDTNSVDAARIPFRKNTSIWMGFWRGQ